MKKIASFTVDHDKLPKGMYISRVDGDCITYDIRTRVPNKEEVMKNDAIHTLEHLVATYVRNTEFADHIIYFGPMGCRTGFYLITRDKVSNADAIKMIQDALEFSANYTDEIPGITAKECGNYKDHDLNGATNEAKMMLDVLKNWNQELLVYPQ